MDSQLIHGNSNNRIMRLMRLFGEVERGSPGVAANIPRTRQLDPWITFMTCRPCILESKEPLNSSSDSLIRGSMVPPSIFSCP